MEPEYQRIVLRDSKAVQECTTPESQQHYVESMLHQLQELISQGTVAQVEASVGLADLWQFGRSGVMDCGW